MSKSADLMRETLGMAPEGTPTIDNPPMGEDGEERPFRPPATLEIVVKPSTLDNDTLKDNDLAQDYIYARNLTHTLLQLVGNQLAGAAKVAEETEHPRAFGVFNELASTMRNVIQDLLGLQKVFKEVKRDDPYVAAGMPPAPASTQIENQTNIYNGNTTDIIRLMDLHAQQQENSGMKVLDIGDAVDERTPAEIRAADGNSS